MNILLEESSFWLVQYLQKILPSFKPHERLAQPKSRRHHSPFSPCYFDISSYFPVIKITKVQG